MALPSVLILGGGITGVTCGIVLQILGFRTRIVCQHWLGTAASTQTGPADPRFASLYPAASIIPHTVQIENESWHMHCGQTFFDLFADLGLKCVRRQRHFEVFEAPCSAPDYAQAMSEFEEILPDALSQRNAPRRCDDRQVYGWSFRTLFAEMPLYRTFLADLYAQLGGAVLSPLTVTPETLAQFPEDIVLNCSGAWSPSLFHDPLESRFVKGLLLRVDAGGSMPVHQRTGELTSYNYHPDASVYAQADGPPADVYFYPRHDVCLLGGTRLQSLPLTVDDVGSCDRQPKITWRGEEYSGETLQIPAADLPGRTHTVPRPILELNAQLVKGLTGVDLRTFPVTAMMGFRHQRQHVRLEQQAIGSRLVIHNYGHGGAGVTLSWSCAMKAAQMLMSLKEISQISEEVLAALKNHVAGSIGGCGQAHRRSV
ncbi:MAG: FAD-binding oxidoreductase [Planctomycetaceae bacterium]|nr:FAD-binding oxidoreductase [Planctomycetaceae bacterium]